jgi:hypothetical protein
LKLQENRNRESAFKGHARGRKNLVHDKQQKEGRKVCQEENFALTEKGFWKFGR